MLDVGEVRGEGERLEGAFGFLNLQTEARWYLLEVRLMYAPLGYLIRLARLQKPTKKKPTFQNRKERFMKDGHFSLLKILQE